MQRRLFQLSLVLLGLVQAESGPLFKSGGFRLESTADSRIQSNGIVDILVSGETFWVATGEGLSTTADFGQTWTNVSHENGLGRGSVTALAIRNGVVWAATAFDTTTLLGDFAAGGGLGYSTDQGKTWHWSPQPVDSRGETRYKPTTTNIQNITYDIALTDSVVWITSFGGGLRKSTDKGETWQVVTVDGLPFDALGHLTHRAFSIHYDGQSLWAGTAGGIHKSTDGGKTWITYTHQNQQRGISGNFVVAIATQNLDGRSVLWASTRETTLESKDSTEFKAISMSEDGGMTWSTALKDETVYNISFDGSTVYAASENGLFKSPDGGETWAVFPKIADAENDAVIYSQMVYCAAAAPEPCLWVGTDDGLALTRDGGITWRIFRAFQTPGEKNEPKTYAYPNPFSPLRHNLLGEEGHVRFQYRTTKPTRVTVRIYDFGMNLVRTAVQNRERPVPGDYAEVWNGRNDVGDMVALGVYFYKLELEGEGTFWGKVLVVN